MPRLKYLLLAVVAGIGVLFLSRCPAAPDDEGEGPSPEETGPVRFSEVTEEAGIRFLHRHGGTGEKYFPETMAGGVIAFDFDGDEDLDLYFIQAGKLPLQPGQEERNVLYRNDGGWKFVDVTRESGLGDDGYGMGGAAADIDNDGDLDLYCTNFGPNRLYRNEGDGTFVEVGARAGVADPSWAVSAAFGDFDADGHVDLYVVNYVNFTMATHRKCGRKEPGFQAYCHPDEYLGVDDVLYHNRGDGTFEDATREAISGPMVQIGPGTWIAGESQGKGMGVVLTDYDLDGDLDIYVANDSTRNYLFVNHGDGTFDEYLAAGVAFNEDGTTEASMGVDAGDVDGDGWFDLFMVHLDGETNTLYRNEGDGLFSDYTSRAGVGTLSTNFVGFSLNLFDYDNDGDEDIFVANGHTIDNIALYRSDGEHAQTDFLLQNDGTGRFRDVSRESGDYFLRKMVGRSSAVGDFDNDGDVDIAICNGNQPAVLLRNDGGNRNHSILFRLRGTRSNRDGIGAFVKIEAAGVSQVDEVRAGSAYQAQSDLRLHFGLGETTRVDTVEVRWPSGKEESFSDLPADHIFFLEEGKGITSRIPFKR